MRTNRIWPGIALAGVLLGGGPALGQRTPDKKDVPGPVPVITADKAEYDFGTAVQGEDVEHVFTIRNKGKGLLKIEKARGG